MEQVLDATAGKVAELESFNAKHAPAALPELGPNEFEATVMLYGVPSDEGRIIEQGALASCTGKLVTVHWEHSVPIGIARLQEMPGIGVRARGRIAVFTATGYCVANLMWQQVFKELCLSSKTVRASLAKLVNGREFVIIHEAQAVELSITLRGGIPGTGITRLGRFEMTETDWDRRFFPEGLEILRADMARTLQFYADIRKQGVANITEAEYEKWIAEMSF